MIEARVKKARRLLDLQRDLQRLEQGRVAGLQSRQAELAALQKEILCALNTETGLQGLFVPMIARRLRSLGEEAARVADELERRLQSLQVQAGRTKYAERRARGHEQEYAKIQAEKELIDIIERLARPEDASLP